MLEHNNHNTAYRWPSKILIIANEDDEVEHYSLIQDQSYITTDG